MNMSSRPFAYLGLIGLLLSFLSVGCGTPPPTVKCPEKACPSGQTCDNGLCKDDTAPPPICKDGATACGSACVQITSDTKNCGGCGAACAAGQVCMLGKCQASCGVGYSECDGGCYDVQRTGAHCGRCGSDCGEKQSCSEGACVDTCPSGQVSCGGACVDTAFHSSHCGGCFQACEGSLVCSEGACVSDEFGKRCRFGLQRCSQTCVNIMTNKSHCGGCGSTCKSGETCNSGKCQAPQPTSTNFAQMKVGSVTLPTCSYTKVSGSGSNTIYNIQCGSLSVIEMQGTISSGSSYDLVTVDSLSAESIFNTWLSTILKGNNSTSKFTKAIEFLLGALPMPSAP